MINPTPPRFFLRFLEWFCDPGLHRFIEGDLIELYRERVGEYGKRRADRRLAADVVLLFRPGIIRSFHLVDNLSSQQSMLKNYFKVAWRNIWKHKLYSAINISGLTIGLASFILIALYLQYELSYDSHHEKADQIYRVIQQQKGNVFRGTDFFAVTPEPLASALLEIFPEVQAAATVNDPRYVAETVILGYREKVFSPRILYSDENIFDIFTIPMVEGVGKKALEDPNTILLSESLAEKYFGEESPLGKEMVFDNAQPLTVRGVFEDPPQNQHLVFEYIVPLKNYQVFKNDIGKWGSNNYRTYLLLPDGYDYKALERKMSAFDDKIEAA